MGCLILVLIIAGIVGFLLINDYFDARQDFAIADHSKKKIELSQKWQEELWQAYGNGDLLKGITNDPNLTVLRMIEEISNRVAQPFQARVSVENFTEFDVYVTVSNQIKQETASKIVKNILALLSDYVNSIKFIYQDNIVKMIEKREIDKVKDWQSVELSDIENLFTTP